MRRIGIPGDGFIEWAGGVDLLRMVIGAMVANGEPLAVHVFLPVRGPRVTQAAWRHRWRVIRGKAQPRVPLMSVEALQAGFEEVSPAVTVHRIDRGEVALARAATAAGVQVLLPAMSPLSGALPCPWMGYVYDFQHRHLPEYFSPAVAEARDRQFEHMLAAAPAVVVNARAVAADIARFVPGARASVVAMPFCAAPRPAWFDLDTEAARRRHGLGDRYFMVANQFWRHKDHEAAFRAFAALGPRWQDAELVCTGTPADERFPDHVPRLLALLRELKVDHRVRVLGLIPKAEQLAILKGAQALVQPTRFEGGPGGGAVYDAVALGVPCIVSDIPVNRELDEPDVRFFPVGDVAALAEAMDSTAWRAPTPVADRERLLAEGRARAARCGRTLLEAVDRLRR